jgi:hypothetical protein
VAIGLPRWRVTFDRGSPRERTRIMQANCAQAALRGAIIGLTYHYPPAAQGFNEWEVAPYDAP